MRLTSYKRWNDREREHIRIARSSLRYTFPQELDALLHYNGFTITRQAGDWSGAPLGPSSPCIITVCRRRIAP